MTIAVNGIAHIQLTINKVEGLAFWEALCHFLEMQTLISGDNVRYFIGSRTGILVRLAPAEKRGQIFDQDRCGLHHFCFRARRVEDVDQIYRFVVGIPGVRIVHPPRAGDHFAPGYYSFLFEDPDGIRVEFNYVPGKGHFGAAGRLGPAGAGPASAYGDSGLTDE